MNTALRVLAVGSFLTAWLTVSVARADMVTVGSPGNTADPATGSLYGSVDYTYQISEFEVTAGEWRGFLNDVASPGTPNPYGLYNANMWSNTYGCKIQDLGSGVYSAAADWANRPVNYVSWYDAARYCNWLTTGSTETGVYDTSASGWGSSNAGDFTAIMDHQAAAAVFGTAYFIPTEDEWYKAAYYDPSLNGGAGGYWDYPTRSDVPNTPTNQFPTNPDPGNFATFYFGGYNIGSPYYRTEVGAHENSASPFGTYDQGGNVWEYNETLKSSSNRGLGGGSFIHGEWGLRADYRNYSSSPTLEGLSFGFRVASIGIVPEPGSLGLLGLAGLVGLKRRRRACR